MNRIKVAVAALAILFLALLGYFNRALFLRTFSRANLVAEVPLSESTRRQNNLDSLRKPLPDRKEITNRAAPSKTNLPAGCSFGATPASSHQELPVNSAPSVIFNEIAWMGDTKGAENEWIEIKNRGSDLVDLSFWTLVDKDEQIKFVFPQGAKIPAGGFYLLRRASQDFSKGALPKADAVYNGNLKNSNEGLRLFDEKCRLVDEVLANPSWPAGDNDTKKTMERGDDLVWRTSTLVGGTPREENSTPSPPAHPTSSSAAISSTEAIAVSPSSSPVVPFSPAGDKILVSEIMVGATENSSYEFIELYNPNSFPIDLTGWSIKKKASSGKEYPLVAAKLFEGKIIPAQKYFLLANSNWGGSVPADILWPPSYTLAYTNNAVVIYNAAGLQVEEISWSKIDEGESWERISWERSDFRLQPSPNPRNSRD